MKTETIILSIHPSHIEKILSGEKQYEYRKRIPADIRHIVVYATAPIKKIVALIEHLDYNVGRVYEALKKNGQLENTIIIFTSDNGGQDDAGANNGPFRGG